MKRQVRFVKVLLLCAGIAAIGLALTAEEADAGGFIFRRGAKGEISVGAWRSPSMVRPPYVTPYIGGVLPSPPPPVYVYPSYSPPPVFTYPPSVHVISTPTVSHFNF